MSEVEAGASGGLGTGVTVTVNVPAGGEAWPDPFSPRKLAPRWEAKLCTTEIPAAVDPESPN